MDMKSAATAVISKSSALAMEHGVTAVSAFYAAIYTRVEIVAVLGSIVAATAIMGMLGLFLSEVVPAMRIPSLQGRSRLICNWCCGLLAYWTSPVVKDQFFPTYDMELVAGATAAVQSLLGISFMIILLRIVLKRAADLENKFTSPDKSNDGTPRPPSP